MVESFFCRLMTVSFRARTVFSRDSEIIWMRTAVCLELWRSLFGFQRWNKALYWLFVYVVAVSQLCNLSLLYCSNSCTSLHFKTLKSHTKTLKNLDQVGTHTHTHTHTHTDGRTEWFDIQPHTGTLYNKCKSTFEFSNVAKYGHGPPSDGFKRDRNMLGRILSVLVWDSNVLKYSEIHELEQ
jgi:hypothetical protein